MKKAIRTLIIVLACFFALSCTKSDMLAITLLGKWELFKVDSSVAGQQLEPEYPSQNGTHRFFDFKSDDVFIEEIVSPKGSTRYEGSWLVDGDCVVITTTSGSFRYQVEKAVLTELVLFNAYIVGGVSYTDRYTFKK